MDLKRTAAVTTVPRKANVKMLPRFEKKIRFNSNQKATKLTNNSWLRAFFRE